MPQSIVVDTDNEPFLLHSAVLLEDLPKLQTLLTSEDINGKNKDGDTPLHLAVTLNNLEVLQILLSSSTLNRNAKNNQGNSALLVALSKGNTDTIKFLLQDGGFDLYEKNAFGPTLIHFAIECSDVEIVEAMITKGNIHLQNEMMVFNLLEKAFVRDKLEIFNYFLSEVKSNPDFLPIICHFFRLAILRKKASFMNNLLAEAEIDLANNDFATFNMPIRDNIQNILNTEGDIAKVADPKEIYIPKFLFPLGYKPVHVAAAIGDEYLLRQLVNKGNVDVNALNHHGHTPLYQAAWKGNLGCVEYFLHLSSVNANPLTGFSLTANDFAAFKKAIQTENIDLIKQMLLFPEIRNALHIGSYLAAHNNVILRRATRYGDIEFVNFLLSHTEVLENVTANQNSALHIAQDNGHDLIELRLLQIPAVRNFDNLNLGQIAQHPENSTTNMYRNEQGLLSSVKAYNKNIYDNLGRKVIFKDFIHYLESQYE
ncbi:MAG TPA: ankyrin repeat domain-containing protein, partial [Gammaproteobacteria bacterium]|nr:ankyrin repeat domain-containing protein [Gammaproteobacteria bacterium]